MDRVTVQILYLSGELIASFDAGFAWTVADVLEQLLAAGEFKICTLVLDDMELTGHSTLRGCGFKTGINTLIAIFRTKQWLSEANFTPATLMKTDGDAMASRTTHKLKSGGYTARELRASGYTCGELRACLEPMKGHNATPLILKKAGFSLAEMLKAGYSGIYLRTLSFPLASFRELDWSCGDLVEIGFTALEFLAVGYTLSQLQKVGFSARHLKQTKCWPLELKQAGYSAIQLKVAGYSLAQIKHVFNLAELKDAGYTAWVLGKSGFGIKELSAVGFCEKDLADAGFIRNTITSSHHSIRSLSRF